MPRVREPSLPKAGPGSAFASIAALSPKVTMNRSNGGQRPHRNVEHPKNADIMDFDRDNDRNVKQAFAVVGIGKQKHISKPLQTKANNLQLKTDRRKRSLLVDKDEGGDRLAKRMTDMRNVVLGRPIVEAKTTLSKRSTESPSDNPKRPRPPFTVKQLPSSSSKNAANRRHRQALAVDTRMLATHAGREEASLYLQHVQQFIQDIGNKGVAPYIMASTVEKSPSTATPSKRVSTRPTIGVQAVTYHDGSDGDLELLLSPISIPPPINASNTDNVQAILVPKPLLAHDSWKLFGELVEAIVQHDQKKENSGKRVPMDITILTNDIAMLCDTKSDSHKQSVNRFWTKMQGSFSNSQVGNIEIVVAQTGRVALKCLVKENDSNKEGGKNESTLVASNGCERESDWTSGKKQQQQQQAGASSAESTTKNLHHTHVQECLAAIEHQFKLRTSQDLKKLHQVSFMHHEPSTVPVNVSLMTLPNTRVGYLSMYRKWICSALNSQQPSGGRIHFDLPETLDGTVCSVSLDVTYKLLPHRLDSQASLELANDLAALSTAHVELIQLVPVSCLDASLLFGTPMAVRAGMELEMAQYQEMKQLVRCLLDHLTQKQLALVLRTSASQHPERSPGSTATEKEQMFHHHSDRQLFVLMAEDLNVGPSATECTEHRVSNSGVLFRYASAYHFAEESAGSDVLQGDNLDATSDTVKQYEEYVENALECLYCDAINPLVIDATIPTRRPPPALAATSPTQDLSKDPKGTTESVWNDTVGVGVRRAESPAASSSDSSEEEDDFEADVGDDHPAEDMTSGSSDLEHDSFDKNPLVRYKKTFLDDDDDDDDVEDD